MLKILKINPLDGKGPIEVVVDNSNFGGDRLERFMADANKDFDELQDLHEQVAELLKKGEHPGEELSRDSMAAAAGMVL